MRDGQANALAAVRFDHSSRERTSRIPDPRYDIPGFWEKLRCADRTVVLEIPDRGPSTREILGPPLQAVGGLLVLGDAKAWTPTQFYALEMHVSEFKFTAWFRVPRDSAIAGAVSTTYRQCEFVADIGSELVRGADVGGLRVEVTATPEDRLWVSFAGEWDAALITCASVHMLRELEQRACRPS